MFILDASKSNLTVRQRELMASGSVNVNTVKFEFSPDWEGLTKTAVFRNDAENRSILLDGTNQCEIPREVLSAAGQRVYAGVYGTRGQETVLPTIWASLGVVLAGAAPDGGTYPPTPELWEQELAKKQDKLRGEPGQLVGFDESGNAVAQDAGEAMQGPPGPQGVPGKDGKSAYQIAVENGFEGTEEEWLESLQGPPGKDGAPGPAGLPGAAGAEGPPGSSGTTFTPSVSSDGVLSWTNDGNLPNPEPVNINGPAGANGADGTDGENGVGVPPGGAAGQILSKKTAADYDTQWIDAPQSGGNYLADEYDTDDGWHIRKYKDGYIEMSIYQTVDMTKYPFKSWGTLVYADRCFPSLTLPVQLISVYSEQANYVSYGDRITYIGAAWLYLADSINSDGKALTKTAEYGLISPNGRTMSTATISRVITGRWK